MTIVTDLFTEKFRPQKLVDLIAVPRIRKEFQHGLTQNTLLYGTPGTGKTSAMKILAKGHTGLFINAGTDARVDTIRNQISEFCAGISLFDNRESLKVIMLDEFDGASDEFLDAIKNVMEKFAKTTRFIACTNYIHKLPDPVQSRFNCVSFDPINSEEESYLTEEYAKRVKIILGAAKIGYTDETLKKFIRNDFPDMRTLLNKIQSFYNQKITELDPKFFNINFDYKDLFEICLKGTDKPYDNYKLIVSEYSSRIDEALSVLGSDLPEYIRVNSPKQVDKIAPIIISVAEYQYQKNFAIDPMITLLAAVFRIQQILS
ncbi:MAG: AAA family ATPase [Chloroflexia bacterium]|nr:AAA family ATPase [Chloroflexia bacterium]